MKCLVVYASYTGYTRKYADWIAEEMQTQAVPLKEFREDMLQQADTVVFGGAVRGSIITGQARMERMLRKAGTVRAVWFAVGIREPSERTQELVRKNNLGGERRNDPLFYFPGGMDREQLKPGDKTMLMCYRAMIKRRKDSTPEDVRTLERMRINGDYTDRECIRPLIGMVSGQ